jgi:hypothetical protein
MKTAQWLKQINSAISTLEELENLRSQFEDECSSKSDKWQESEKGEKATEIHETDIQGLIDTLEDLKSNVENF